MCSFADRIAGLAGLAKVWRMGDAAGVWTSLPHVRRHEVVRACGSGGTGQVISEGAGYFRGSVVAWVLLLVFPGLWSGESLCRLKSE